MKSGKGFTLIELLLVVSLVILLGTLSTGFTARFMTQNGVINATDQLVGDIRKAQLNAMMGKQGGVGTNGNWGVNYTPGTLTLYKGGSYGERVAGLEETFSVGSGITISGFNDINFTKGTGLPSASPTPTIIISGKGGSQSLYLNNQGVITR